jgi:hypothetical protein
VHLPRPVALALASHTGRMPGVAVSRRSTSLDGGAAAPVFGYTAVGAPALAARLTISRDGFTVAAR